MISDFNKNKSAGPPENNFSVAKVILASLWELEEASLSSIINHPHAHVFCRHKNKNTYHTSIKRLLEAGLIQYKTGKRNILHLTKKGQREALFAHVGAWAKSHTKTNQGWDGGWRIVFFDIPEQKRKFRDYLRTVLKSIGFMEFQKSVWVYPFAAPLFLKDLLSEENIKQHTRFITTTKIDYDQDLRAMFKLK